MNATDPLIGQPVGSWRITRLLGQGGMGRVYEAVHPTIGGRVAVKVLAQTEDKDLVARFFAEARAVNVIRHEMIVNVLDLAELPDGRPYIVMEYVDGAPLSSVIRKGPMPLGSLCRLVGEVLDALAAAHGKGIIHRDLKPDNIFVTPAGHAKVLDFGIAKLSPELNLRGGPTQTGSLLGTPAYMSPEQANAKAVDARTDLYAIGVILYEATTGRVPFEGESLFALLRMIVEEPPAAPRSLRPDIPPVLNAIILRALEKDPQRRFQSAAELATALSAAARDLSEAAFAPLSDGPVSAGHRLPVPPTRPGASPVPNEVQDEGSAPTVQSLDPYAATHATPAPAVHVPVTLKTSGPPKWAFVAGGVALAALGATAAVIVANHQKRGGPPTALKEVESPQPPQPPVPEPTSQPTVSVAQTPEPTKPPPVVVAQSDRPKPKPALPPMPPPVPQTVSYQPAQTNNQLITLPDGMQVVRGDDATHGFKPPMPSDLANFDVIGFLPTAERYAKDLIPDAELDFMSATEVRADGRTDLTRGNSVNYQFISRQRRDLSGPTGMLHFCNVVVYVSAQYTFVSQSKSECTNGLAKEICSVPKMWAAVGLPPDAVAEIELIPGHGWMIKGPNGVEKIFDKGCP